jgi:hypothetical protein
LKRKKRYGKYGAIKSVVDGYTFASQKEARRYGVLKLLQRAGEIKDLKLQVWFMIEVNGTHICDYVADFTYLNKREQLIVEDVKGVRTRIYSLKKKLMKAIHNIKIKET